MVLFGIISLQKVEYLRHIYRPPPGESMASQNARARRTSTHDIAMIHTISTRRDNKPKTFADMHRGSNLTHIKSQDRWKLFRNTSYRKRPEWLKKTNYTKVNSSGYKPVHSHPQYVSWAVIIHFLVVKMCLS